MLLVGIDVSKSSWYVMAADMPGNVVIPGTKLMAFAADLARLVTTIQRARDVQDARLVVIGVEATGHFRQTLAAYLADVPGVTFWLLLNPAAVAAVRDAQLNRRHKTDELDADRDL